MKEELYCLTKELVTKYGKIDEIFWDGGWLGQQGSDAAAAYFWEPGKYLDSLNQWPVNPYFEDKDSITGRPLGLMGMVRKYQPDVIVNPRSSWCGDFQSEEGSAPVTGPVRAKEIYEKCLSISPTWGYSPDMEDPARLYTVPAAVHGTRRTGNMGLPGKTVPFMSTCWGTITIPPSRCLP